MKNRLREQKDTSTPHNDPSKAFIQVFQTLNYLHHITSAGLSPNSRRDTWQYITRMWLYIQRTSQHLFLALLHNFSPLSLTQTYMYTSTHNRQSHDNTLCYISQRLKPFHIYDILMLQTYNRWSTSLLDVCILGAKVWGHKKKKTQVNRFVKLRMSPCSTTFTFLQCIRSHCIFVSWLLYSLGLVPSSQVHILAYQSQNCGLTKILRSKQLASGSSQAFITADWLASLWVSYMVKRPAVTPHTSQRMTGKSAWIRGCSSLTIP